MPYKNTWENFVRRLGMEEVVGNRELSRSMSKGFLKAGCIPAAVFWKQYSNSRF